MNYDEKLRVANAYLMHKCGVGWNELSDINSLHDVETIEDVHSLCEERLDESGFPDD
jgi:hypothetical protein